MNVATAWPVLGGFSCVTQQPGSELTTEEHSGSSSVGCWPRMQIAEN